MAMNLLENYKRIQILRNYSDEELMEWINAHLRVDKMPLARMTDNDTWLRITNRLGVADMVQRIISASRLGTFDPMDDYFVYDEDGGFYSAAGSGDMWDLFEDEICRWLENN